MAITWGTEVRNSTGNGMRVGYEFSQSPGSVGAGTSSVIVTCKVYVWTRAPVYDANNVVIISGDFDWSGSVNISHGAGGGITLARTLTRSVSPSYAGTVKSSVSASLSGLEAISGTARVSGSHTTGKRPISAPDAPSNANVSRSSDSRQNLSWTRNNPSTTSKPYQSQELQRWDNIGGAWRTIANLSAAATSYSDSSTGTNRRYQYRVRSKNSAGASSWASTNHVNTTPSAPSSAKARKSGGNIAVTWANNASDPSGVRILHAADGVWDAGGPIAVINDYTPPSQWIHSSPDPSKTHQYWVGSFADEPGQSTLYSAYSAPSNIVQLLTNPVAPTKLSPSSGARDVSEDDLVLTWQHNDVDSTEQTGYDLRYRLDGGAWTTITDLSSSASRRTFAAGALENGHQFEWQVRTYGDYSTAPAYSPWSTTSIITFSARPAVTVTAPDALIQSSRATVRWDFFDPEGSAQTSYRVRLENSSDDSIYDRSFSGSAKSLAVPVTLADGGSYTVFVSARDGAGLWSAETSQLFSVDYADPPRPVLEAYWDLELGGVVITFDHPSPAPGEVPVVSAELWRSANGEDWALVAADLEISTSVVDFIPALDAVNYYRITSVSALPSRSDSASYPVVTESKGWVFVNGGPGFAQVAKIRDNASVGGERGRAKARHHFAGREFPMETTGESRTKSISLSARIGGGSSTVEEWAAIADLPAPLCYRDPSQREFVGVNPLSDTFQKVTKEISISFEKVDYIE